MSLVEARDLRFVYPDGQFGVQVPSWSVHEGQRVGLFGPSGCGKSTLLNLVAGLLPVGRGSLRVGEHELAGRSEASRRALRLARIGFIFQDFPLVDYLDAQDNVLLPYRLGGLRLTADVRRRATDLLGALELGPKARRRPDQLSQGERQRVAIARALVTEPRLLLADEPTTGLDPARADAVFDLVSQLCVERGLTLIMVTHDPRFADRLDQTWDVGAWTVGGAP